MGKRKVEEVEAEEEVVVEKKKKSKKAKKEVEEEEPVEETKAEKKAKKKAKKAKEAEEEEEPVRRSPRLAAQPSPKTSPKKSPKQAPAEAEDEEGTFTAVLKGLPWSCDEDSLKKDFGVCGEITRCKLLMNDEGQSRGIAFIDFTGKKALTKACEWNETEYNGRSIYVKDANEGGKGKDGKGKGKGKGGPKEKPEGCKSVIVKQLSYAATEDDLWELFEDCGSVSRVKMLMDRDTGESKGMAFVDFDESADVDKALKKNDTVVKGKAVYIDFSVPREKGEKGKDGKGKGKGKDGKGKGKGKADSMARSKNTGSIQEFKGAKQTFGDSD